MSQISQLAIESLNNIATDLLKNNGSFEVREMLGNNSIVYVAKRESNYVVDGAKDVTVAKIKEGGKLEYISFFDKFSNLFDKAEINYNEIKSDNFIRFGELEFLAAIQNPSFSSIIEHIVLSSFNYPNFGCCSKYVQCSDAGHCLHSDIFYATASCQYKKHLDNGEIFYGEKANIK